MRRAVSAVPHLAVLRGNRADGERDSLVDDGRAGNGILGARPGVVGVVVVAIPVEALVVRRLKRRRRDAERVEGGRQVDRRRDDRGSGRSRGRGAQRRLRGGRLEPHAHARHAVGHDMIVGIGTIRTDRQPGLFKPRAE